MTAKQGTLVLPTNKVKSNYVMSDGSRYTGPVSVGIPRLLAKPKPVKTEYYAKPKGASDLPKWFKEIRAGSQFMPAKVKPLSYNYMAIAETPNRTWNYAPADKTQLDVGTMFHRPSDAVGSAIQGNMTVWQDIKNLGGKVLQHGANLLGRIGDILSRPGYAVRNVLMRNYQDKYMTPDSAGGTGVTGMEHLKALWSTFSPAGIIADIVGGRGDEIASASWAGLSGKAKTSISDVIKATEPEWAAAHPKLTGVAGFGGDLLVDPLTWVTMGVNPGSVSRAGIAGIQLLKLDRAGAVRTLESTVFTKTGLKNSAEAIRSDTLGQQANKFLRQERKARTKGDNAAADRFLRQANSAKSQMHYAKANKIAQEHADWAARDLKGAALAKLMIKQNLNPLTAMSTASRFTTGAHKAGVAIKAGQTVKEAMDAFHIATANALADEDNWILAFENMKGKDIEYTHGRSGKKYVVDLKDRDDLHEWMLRVVQEAAPIAKFTESGIKQARSRKGRTVDTEARARAFINEFGNQAKTDFLTQVYTGGGRFDPKATITSRTFREADPDEMQDPRIPKFTEDEWANASADDVLKAADDAWRRTEGGTPNQPVPPKRIIIVDDNGKGRITDAEAVAAHMRRNRRVSRRAAAGRAAADSRSPQRAAMDTLSGVDDELAARRSALEQHFSEVSGRSPAHGALVQRFIDRVMDYTSKDDMDSMVRIMSDESRPIEERVAEIIGDNRFSNRVANEVLRNFFEVDIKNGKVKVWQSTAGTPAQAMARIPEIVKQVMLERWDERIIQTGLYTDDQGRLLPSGILKASNVEFRDGKFYANGQPLGKVDPNFQRDLNAEIGLGLMEGVRYGLSYAVKMDLLQNNPEEAFAMLYGPMTDAVNGMTADMKSQVMQLMYNLTGQRLPETFVPTRQKVHDVITRGFDPELPPEEVFYFKKTNGEAIADMERAWESLEIETQTWMTKNVFGDIIPLEGSYRTGFNLEKYLNRVVEIARSRPGAPQRRRVSGERGKTSEMSEAGTQLNPRGVQRVTVVMEAIDKLMNSVPFESQLRPINGNVENVNNYTGLDFLMHTDAILKSQRTTMHRTRTKPRAGTQGNAIVRANVGRLSALDSFNFVSDETQIGLAAVQQLKKWANMSAAEMGKSPENHTLAIMARQKLADLFLKQGGGDAINYNLTSRTEEAVVAHLNSMGGHAALKELPSDRARPGSSFGTAYAAQLMERLWGQESLIHEWQKSFQNSIVFRSIVLGDSSPEMTARAMAQSLDEHFANHDRIKRLLHPVVENRESAEQLARDIEAGQQNLNPVTPLRSKAPPVGAEEYLPGGVLQHPDTMEINQVEAPTAPTGEPRNRNVFQDVGNRFNTPQDPTAPTPPTPDVVVDGPMTDPSDFVNTSSKDITLNEEERKAIRNWIASEYIDAPPGKIEATIDATVNTLTTDLYMAQLGMVEHMKDMGIAHKANIRFMGVPFMPIFNPMNANHATAGITTYAQARSRGIRFWQNILGRSDPGTADNTMAGVRKYMTRQSNLLEGAINQVYTSTVNAVAETRKLITEDINQLSMQMHKGEYKFAPMNQGTWWDRIKKANAKIFDPNSHTGPGSRTAFDEFDLVDGTNPVKTMLANMERVSQETFSQYRVGSPEWEAGFSRFNNYVHRKMQLSGGELERVMTISKGMPTVMPFSPEWWARISNNPLMADTRWGKDRLKDVNLIDLQMNMQDAALRIREGRVLHRSIWQEFSAPMTEEAAKAYNAKIANLTTGVDGTPMRGNLVKVADIRAGGHGIESYAVPKDILEVDGVPRYIDEKFLPEIKTLIEFMAGTSKINETIDTKFLHKILGLFKQSVTIYKVPTYPIRNTLADVFLSAMDGLTNPRYYRDAARIVQNAHRDSKVIDSTDFTDVLNKQMLRDELARNMNDPDFKPVDPAVGAPMTTLSLRGMGGKEWKLNDPQIMELFNELGLGMNRVSTDVQEAVAGSRLDKSKRAPGAIHDKMRLLNDWREDWGRMAHFVYALEREAPLGGDLMDIGRRAANRVIKHHFDYNDLSLFGRRVLGQWIPFYKWMRNIIPYTLASLVTKPYMIKTEQALSDAFGTAIDDNPEDTRTDFIIPDYIKNDSPVDIGWYSDANGNKFMQWMGVSFPLTETIAGSIEPWMGPLVNPAEGDLKTRAANAAAGGIRVAGGALNPIAGGAIQAATGQQIWASSASPVQSPTTWVETMTSVIPGLPTLRDLEKSGEKLFSDTGASDINKLGTLLDSLGVANVQNNSESAQLGAVHKLEDQNRAQRDKLTSGIKNKVAKKYPQLTPDQVDMVVDEYLKMLRTQQRSGQPVGPQVDVGQM